MPSEIRFGHNPVANSAAIIAESVRSPRSPSIIIIEAEEEVSVPGRPDVMGMAIRKTKRTTEPLSSNYKTLLNAVIALTLISIVIAVALAFFAKEPPTSLQADLFRLADFGWKVGLGALVGLLGGKQL